MSATTAHHDCGDRVIETALFIEAGRPIDFGRVSRKDMPSVQQQALIRLHVYFTGRTHELLIDVADELIGAIERAADSDGNVPQTASISIQRSVEAIWTSFMDKWVLMFFKARLEAATMPLGTMYRFWVYYRNLWRKEEARRMGLGDRVLEEVEEPELTVHVDGLTDPDDPDPTRRPIIFQVLQEQVDAASARLYNDGLNLSQRIWRFDQASQTGIRAVLNSALNNGDSALSTARLLEQFLGIGRECPRWTTTRLFQLSPIERSQVDTGLIRGPSPCGSTGVAYNALRLARNEIQVAHHAATRAIQERQPWIEGENIVLSPVHPVRDICDDVAEGGPYPIGEHELPLHVQCVLPQSLIETPNGQVPIQRLSVGDVVITDKCNRRAITNVWASDFEGDMVVITAESGKQIVCTPTHPLLTMGGWVAAQSLEVGSLIGVLRCSDERAWDTHGFERVASIEPLPYTGQVYNLTVADDETYVSDGIISHNCLCYSQAVLMDDGEFVDRMRSWVDGGEWPEMDQFAEFVGS